MVPLAKQANRANLVFPATTRRSRGTRKANAIGARLVLLDRPASLDPKAQMVSKDRPVSPANQAKLDRKDHPDRQDQLVRKVATANPARKANLARTLKKAKKDHPALLAKLASLDRKATTAVSDRPANLAAKATTDHPAHRVKAASLATKDQLARPDPKARLVQTPTIVLARNAARPPPRPPRKRKPKPIAKKSWLRGHSPVFATFNINRDSVADSQYLSHTSSNPVLNFENVIVFLQSRCAFSISRNGHLFAISFGFGSVM